MSSNLAEQLRAKIAPVTAAVKGKQDRAPEEFWGNIGLYASYVDENGDEQQKFISLNYGIPLSAVEDMKKSNSIEWNAQCAAKDSLRDQLLEVARNLEPGATQDVELVLQIRRVGEKPTIASDANPFMVSIKK